MKRKELLLKKCREMRKRLFVLVLSLFICGPAFGTLCYVEFEPGTWSFANDVFDFEQGIEIQYSQGCDDLSGYTVNLPSLNLVVLAWY